MRLVLAWISAVGLLVSYAYHGPSVQPGVVHGVVVDSAGNALSGVLVELTKDATTFLSAQTDVQGRFRFVGVSKGTYGLRAVLNGYNQTSTTTVTVGDQPLGQFKLILALKARDEEIAQETLAQAQSRVQRARKAADAQAREGALMSSPAAPPPAGTPSVAGMMGGARYFPNPGQPFHTEAYDRIEDNRFRRVTNDPVSTFSVDVDTASYSNVRRFLKDGQLPPADAVRTEELINYFRFAYPNAPSNAPFSVTTEVGKCPWNPRNKLVLIGLQSRRLDSERTPPRNLVFLLDVSGSMDSPDKLPLVRNAMSMLADTLTEADRVSIVVYAGASGLVLPPTSGHRKDVIKQAISELRPGGSTNGAAGIHLAYNVAASSFMEGGINRVILATDGDFNVGVTSQGELVRLIEQQRERGVFLSVLGVGTGNLKDSTMEKLADKGNGNYAYLDSLHEAKRVLIAEAGATLVTVAKDVKIQAEFNPAVVGAYRLIGYENRLLNREDFNDDRKDAGEIGAGHSVTALYEVIPAGERIDVPSVDPLKYQEEHKVASSARSGELMTVSLRYKRPDASTSQLMTHVVGNASSESTSNLGFAAAVAQFGMLLRGSEFKGESTWESTRDLARRYRGDDPDGYREEFIRLIDQAAALNGHRRTTETTARR
jgi:Ca-activated chloride channel family protein